MDLKINEITQQLAVIENQIEQFKILEKRQKELKEALKEAMEENGVKGWETPDGIKITLIPDVPDEEINKVIYEEAKFQQENKELFNEYIKVHEKYKTTTKVIQKGKKGFVRITVPKNKEELPY